MMTQSDKIEIGGAVDLTELWKALQAELAAEAPRAAGAPKIELEVKPAMTSRRDPLTVGTLYAVVKGLAALTPLILGILNYIRESRKSAAGDKPSRTLRIVAQDDSVLEVPEETDGESLKKLLESQPKFKNPKRIVVE